MSQHDGQIDNQTMPSARSDINSALQALMSNNSGATAPSTTFAYQWWADTTTGLLKLRNAANTSWLTVGTLSLTGLGLSSSADASIFTGGGSAVDETTRLGAFIAAAAGTYVRVVGDLLLDDLQITVDHNLDLSGARIFYPSDANAIEALGSFGAETSVVAIANAAGVAASDLNSEIELSSTSGWAIGDWFKIWSNNRYNFAADGDQPFRAEFAMVRGLKSGPPRLVVSRLKDTYTTTPKLRKLISPVSRIRGGTFIANGDITDTGSYAAASRLAAIKGYALLSPQWHDLTIDKAWSEGVRLETCVNVDLSVSGRYLLNDTSSPILGYLVHHTYGSQHGHIRILPSTTCRHMWTSGKEAGSPAYDVNNYWKYGGVRGITIDGDGVVASGAAFDTHPWSFDTTFQNCRSSGVRVGAADSKGAFQNRGHNTRYSNCLALDSAYGFLDLAPSYAWGITGKTVYDGCMTRGCQEGFFPYGDAAITNYHTEYIACVADDCTNGWNLNDNARVVLNACSAARFDNAPIYFQGNDALCDIVNGFMADFRQAGTGRDGTTGNGISFGATGVVSTGGVLNVDGLTYISSATRPGAVFSAQNASSTGTIRWTGQFHDRNKLNQVLTIGSGALTIVAPRTRFQQLDSVTTATTDASGDLTITHGLTGTPTVIEVTMGGTTFRVGQPHTIGATTFKIRVLDAAGSAVASTSVTAYWRATV